MCSFLVVVNPRNLPSQGIVSPRFLLNSVGGADIRWDLADRNRGVCSEVCNPCQGSVRESFHDLSRRLSRLSTSGVRGSKHADAQRHWMEPAGR